LSYLYQLLHPQHKKQQPKLGETQLDQGNSILLSLFFSYFAVIFLLSPFGNLAPNVFACAEFFGST
jgi:hypothetical protein